MQSILILKLSRKKFWKEAKKYTSETDDFEILTELQHYGGCYQPDRFHH